MRLVLLVLMMFFVDLGLHAQEIPQKPSRKFQYQQVDFEDLIRRYFVKEHSHGVEGIYSVSCVITKRKKVLFSKREKVRIVEKQDNYARVAILQDLPGSKQDFIEISLRYHDANKYPIVGIIDGLSEGKGLVYKHIEPNGSVLSFSMISESDDLLEGEYSKIERRKTITYRLSYLKIFPKNPEIVIND
jgi:hypothetical protein